MGRLLASARDASGPRGHGTSGRQEDERSSVGRTWNRLVLGWCNNRRWRRAADHASGIEHAPIYEK